MRFGLDVATDGAWSDVRLLGDLAAEAEAAGWDGFFVWDLLLAEANAARPVADPWVALSVIAERTSRIRIGAMVTALPRRRPWDVARTVATLDHLSGGRMTFGAGLGWQADDFERFGEDPDPKLRAARLDDGLAALAALWSGGPASLETRHVRMHDPVLLPVPVQRPRVPVWIAAGWPRRRPVERAARWDGLVLMSEHQTTHEALTPGDVAEAVAHLRAHRPADAGPIDIVTNFFLDEPVDVPAFKAAGATWLVGLTPMTVEEHRERIRQGPPGGAR